MNPEKHDKATPGEIEKTKAQSGGVIPKVGQEPSTSKSNSTSQPKSTTTSNTKGKPTSTEKPGTQNGQPQSKTTEAPPTGKLSGADFKSSAEKSSEKEKASENP